MTDQLKQRTLKNLIRATGVGLHTGEKVYITVRPAPVDAGIVFVRDDLDEPVSIPAKAENVGDTTMAVSRYAATPLYEADHARMARSIRTWSISTYRRSCGDRPTETSLGD